MYLLDLDIHLISIVHSLNFLASSFETITVTSRFDELVLCILIVKYTLIHAY